MHNCIWNNVVFQPCRDSFRATLTLVVFFSFFYYYYSFNKRWDLKRETIQSSTAHFSPCQNVLRSLSAGLRHRFQPCCLVSSITRCISSLYSCAYVCNRSFCRFFFVVVFSWCVLLLLECRTVLESMPDSHLLSVCVFVPFVWNQLCTIIKLN